MDANTEKQKRELKSIYDDYRRILLSKKYYAKRLVRTKYLARALDLVLALSASSSFASIHIDKLSSFVPYGSAFVALLAAAKPLLAWDKDIERLSKLVASYSVLFEKVKRLIDRIGFDEGLSEEVRSKIQEAQASQDDLASLEDLDPSRQVLLRLQDEVESELPVGAFWWPNSTGQLNIPHAT